MKRFLVMRCGQEFEVRKVCVDEACAIAHLCDCIRTPQGPLMAASLGRFPSAELAQRCLENLYAAWGQDAPSPRMPSEAAIAVGRARVDQQMQLFGIEDGDVPF